MQIMAYFTADYLEFFKELAGNNHKEWFDEHRKRYTKSVKDPFNNYVQALIDEVGKRDKTVKIAPKDAIFRINRDIRFSKDKTPYKTNCSAIISPAGRKDKSNPGLYIEMSPEHYRIYGGVYMPDKDQLYSIRETIAANPKTLDKLMNDKKFTQLFGEIRGEKNKVIPKEFKEVGEQFPIIFNKQFYWFTQYQPDVILKEDLLKKTIDAYETNQALMDYFKKAMQ